MFRERFVRREPRPVLPVDFLVRAPLRVLCDESVFIPNNFPFEVRRQAGMVVGKPFWRISLEVSCRSIMT